MGGGGPKYEQARPAPSALLLEPRRERIDAVLSGRTLNLTVVLDRLEDTFNMAAVLRSCEAFGVQQVHVIENPAESFRPNAKVTQGCDKWLDVVQHPSAQACLEALHASGFVALASATGAASRSILSVEFGGKTALVFGNERHGVSPEVRSRCDGSFWIPMLGFTQSLNISAAVSATLLQAVSWRLANLGRHGDLGPDALTALRERFELLSVKQRRRIYDCAPAKEEQAP